MVEPTTNRVHLQVGPANFATAPLIQIMWKSRYQNDAKMEAAVKSFNEKGCISSLNLIKELKNGPANLYRLAIIDLRQLPEEGAHKIAKAKEYPMPNEGPQLKSFEEFATTVTTPSLFPATTNGLPQAIVFYCMAGTTRSPAMALFYTLWLHQKWYETGMDGFPPCQVCYLEGGYTGLEHTTLSVKESVGLLEWYKQKADPLPVSNMRGGNRR